MASNASTTKAQAQRLPAPSLFSGPPSHNASTRSLLQTSNSGQSPNRTPLLGQRSTRLDRARREAEENAESKAAAVSTNDGQQRPQHGQRENDRNDALWAEMQNTLDEVERGAGNGTHVFSETHAKALEELRTAQIALAQAWARTEADEQASEAAEVSGEPEKMAGASLLAADRKEKLGNKGSGDESKPAGRMRSGTTRTQRSKLEEETENDILLARRRREANDRYFQRVNAGVLDVVAKLDDVAKAMREVEMESKEIWGEKDSIDTGSET